MTLTLFKNEEARIKIEPKDLQKYKVRNQSDS